MDDFAPSMLALFVASLVTGLELLTSKYPRTVFSLTKCRPLYAYLLIYGLISLAFMLGLDALIAGKKVTLEGVGLQSRWVRAVVVGLSTKAFLHINLFSIAVGPKTFPLGTETIVQLFEPWLLEEIYLYEFAAVSDFVDQIAARHTDLAIVKSRIKGNLPQTFVGAERAGFELSVDTQTSVKSALELYLRRFGKTNLTRVFP
jgi:hypothetical protein